MQKKIPMRQCMGCRERKEKRELIRVVRGTDGTVSLDFSGKKNGPGGLYLPQGGMSGQSHSFQSPGAEPGSPYRPDGVRRFEAGNGGRP